MSLLPSSIRMLRRDLRLTLLNTSQNAACPHETVCFELSLDQPFASGWYLIKPQKKIAGLEAFLHLDLGFGYDEAYKISLNCIHAIIAPSVAELPIGVKKIRLMVKTEDARSIVQCQLVFIPIFRAEAVVRIAFHLYRLNKLRGISAMQLLREKMHQIRKAGVVNIIKNLDRFYDYGDTEGPLGYQQWIQRNERLDAAALQQIQNRSFVHAPLVSVVCSSVESLAPLRGTIDSLNQQTYHNWQLFVMVNHDTPGEIVEYVQRVQARDERIILLVAQESRVLSMLDGEYGLWLTAGDRLSYLALYYWVEVINKQPEVIAWYCDSDYLDADGKRHSPHFRPDWNRELYYAQDYIGSCCLFHLPAIRQGSNPEELTMHAEQYDLLLRMLKKPPEDQVGHIPKVLYHHSPDGQQTKRMQKKAANGQRQALRSHFSRLGKDAEVSSGLLAHTHRILYSLPDTLPAVTLIIPTRDQVKILKKCVESVLQQTEYPDCEILVVDNGSRESATKLYLDRLQANHGVRVIVYDKPFNFAAINNKAVCMTNTEMVCLLNNDIEVISPDWLMEMVRYAVQPEIGCVGAKLLYTNDTVQHAGVVCGLGDVAGHAHRYLKRDAPGYFGRLQSAQYYSAVTAACLLVRRDVWNEVGGMNEALAIAYNDIDFCLQISGSQV